MNKAQWININVDRKHIAWEEGAIVKIKTGCDYITFSKKHIRGQMRDYFIIIGIKTDFKYNKYCLDKKKAIETSAQDVIQSLQSIGGVINEKEK